MTTPAAAGRAGFGRRALALVIDILVILTLVTLTGVTLSKLSDGNIRVQSTLLKKADCKRLDTLPAGLDLPRGFKPTSITGCTYSFLSIPYHWAATAESVTQQDVTIGGAEYTTTKKLAYTYPLDPRGRPADPIEIDSYSFVLYGLYFILLEWLLGGTLAQRLLGMRVRSLGGRPASLVQVVKRFVPRFAWLLLVPAGQHLLQSYPDHMVAILQTFVGLNLAILAALVINAVRAMRKGELAWHDRWAGTEVVRTQRHGGPAA